MSSIHRALSSGVLVALLAACGGVRFERDQGDSGSATGSGGGAATTTGAGGEPVDAGGICNAPPPPSPTPPTEPGCSTNMGDGWVAVPCACDLWIANTTHEPISVGIQLTVTPPDAVPTLGGPLDAEVDFEDPDASWYATWSQQPGSGETFAVWTQGGETTVRMGQGSVALSPVEVAACKTRKARARQNGSYMVNLSMHAVLEGGMVIATADLCSNPPPVPPTGDDGR